MFHLIAEKRAREECENENGISLVFVGGEKVVSRQM